MRDNPSLSEKTLQSYENNFTGVFYERYVLGKWVLAEGLIYPNYQKCVIKPFETEWSDYTISIDYGTQNAFSCGLWALYKGVWYRIKEYYYSGRDTGVQKTDTEYAEDLDEFLSDVWQTRQRIKVFIDPSAASFITLLRKQYKNGRPCYNINPADNGVMDGIRDVATAIQTEKIKVFNTCENTINEFGGYVWDDKAGEDKPVKVNDHAMDDMRYFVRSMRLVTPKTPYKSILGA